MTITTVQSNTLGRVVYEENRKILSLEFRDGSVYQYFDVPPTVCQALLAAPSKGAYFNRSIRGKFAYATLS